MAMIHSTAVINSGAQLDTNVSIGAFSVIGANVRIAGGTVVQSHCVIDGHTEIGRDNTIFPFCVLGAVPQDKKYAGEPTRLVIGDRNTIRESCTFNLGTAQGGGITQLGNDNWMMAYVHLAHDCRVGNHTIFANHSTLAGHVVIDDWVILGGFTGVHQFVRVGAHALTGVSSVVLQDVLPFSLGIGAPFEPSTINAEGLKRRGFSPERIADIKRAYKLIFRSNFTTAQAQEALQTLHDETAEAKADIALLKAFMASSERGLARPK
jgi:UDP-N-acetylglucosamine acyltransferase